LPDLNKTSLILQNQQKNC